MESDFLLLIEVGSFSCLCETGTTLLRELPLGNCAKRRYRLHCKNSTNFFIVKVFNTEKKLF